MIPYKWQNECIARWLENDARGIVEVITGAGKTRMALLARKALEEKRGHRIRTFILVPRVALALQWKAVLLSSDYNGESVTIMGGGQAFNPAARVVIGVINSARYRFAREISRLNREGEDILLIADEYHRYTSPENSRIFDFLASPSFDMSRYFALGLSATADIKPYKADIRTLIGPMIYEYTISDALDEGIINPFDIFSISVTLDVNKAKEYDSLSLHISTTLSKLYNTEPVIMRLPNESVDAKIAHIMLHGNQVSRELAARLSSLLLARRDIIINADSRIDLAAAIINSLSSDKKIMVFSERIEQADTLRANLSASIRDKIGIYHSGLEKNTAKRMLTSFKNGDIRILISCKALDEGLDVPDADIGIFMSNTESERQRIQRAGRILRKIPGKARSALYYIYLKGTVESASFISTDSMKINVIQGSFDKLSSKVNIPIHERLVKELCSSIRNKANSSQTAVIRSACRACMLTNDYLQDKDYIDRMISSSSDPSYWRTMKELSRLYQSR